LECEPRAGPEPAPVFPVPDPDPKPEPEAACFVAAVELFLPEAPELELLVAVAVSAWAGEDGEFPMVMGTAPAGECVWMRMGFEQGLCGEWGCGCCVCKAVVQAVLDAALGAGHCRAASDGRWR